MQIPKSSGPIRTANIPKTIIASSVCAVPAPITAKLSHKDELLLTIIQSTAALKRLGAYTIRRVSEKLSPK